MRKILSLLLVFAMTLSVLPVVALTVEINTQESTESVETTAVTEEVCKPETLPHETEPETLPQEEITTPTEEVTEPSTESSEPEQETEETVPEVTEETIPDETEEIVPQETEADKMLEEGLRFNLPPADAKPCVDFENRIQPPYYFYQLNLEKRESAEIYNGEANIFIIAGDSVSLNNATVTAERVGTTVLALTGEGIPECNTAYVIVEVVDGNRAALDIETSLVEDYTIPELGRDKTMGSCIYFCGSVTTSLDFTVSALGAECLSVSVNGGQWETKEGDTAQFTAELENRQNIIGIRAADSQGQVCTFYKTVDARMIPVEDFPSEEEPVETVPEVSKDALLAAIETAGQKKESDYTKEEWIEIQNALKNAWLVIENAEATQEEMISAMQALTAALGNLDEDPKGTEPADEECEETTEPTEETHPEDDYENALSKADEDDLEKAGVVMELIQVMGDDPRAIRYARGAYNVLTNLQKALVVNYQKLLDAEEAIVELRATLTLPAEVIGKRGTALSAIVSVEGWNNAECYQELNCAMEIPAGLEVADVTMSSHVSGGSVYWSVSKTDGMLRIVYTALNGESLTVDGEASLAELFSVELNVKEDVGVSEKKELQICICEMSLKSAPAVSLLSIDKDGGAEGEESPGNVFSINIENAVGVFYLIPQGQVSYTAIRMYQGDGEDLIAKEKKAICVSAAGGTAGKLVFQCGDEEVTLFYNEVISEKSQTPSYVGMVNADIPMEALADAENYTLSDQTADAVVFGDADGNGTIDAQDALTALSIWLRKGGNTLEDSAALCLNINGDSRVNTFDALGILEYYVNGQEFPVVTRTIVESSSVDLLPSELTE